MKKKAFQTVALLVIFVMITAAGPACRPKPDIEMSACNIPGTNVFEMTIANEGEGSGNVHLWWFNYHGPGHMYLGYFNPGDYITFTGVPPGVYWTSYGGLIVLDEEVSTCPTGLQPPTCPDCGPPLWEAVPEGEVTSVQYSIGECYVEDWCVKLDTIMIRVVGNERDFGIYYRGETLEPEMGVGANGNAYYVVEFEIVGNDFSYTFLNDGVEITGSLVPPEGREDWRLPRDILNQYISCSVAPNYSSTDADGVAYRLDGQVSSDWVTFLLDEGYFEQTYAGAAEAEAWVAVLWEEGQNVLPEKVAAE
jgi:hypothetical protein